MFSVGYGTGMAWRIENSVESGELDNRVRGHVAGWIRLYGRAEPLRLDLRGDCHADLAGWRFRIVRLEPVPTWARQVDLQGLTCDQCGKAGDFTADQLLRHFDYPLAELLVRMRAGESPPLEFRTALYAEWYSQRNGRVAIQDTRLGVQRLGLRAFELTEDDLRRRAVAARRAIRELQRQGLIEEVRPGVIKFHTDDRDGSASPPHPADDAGRPEDVAAPNHPLDHNSTANDREQP